MTENNLWIICIEEAFGEAGISATEKQIEDVAEICELSAGSDQHTLYVESTKNVGWEEKEVDRLRAELHRELAKRPCGHCGGSGNERLSVGYSYKIMGECIYCNGTGRKE